MVVSESLARRKWPEQDPVGQSIKIGDEVLTVIGVARSARSLAPGDPDAVELYRLARETDLTGLAIVARTAGPSAALASAFSAAANSVDPNFKPQVQLLKDQFEQSVRDVESGAIAVGVLGVIALAVACLGVVGLVSYSVAQRTKEIGIRLALGAQSRHIVDATARATFSARSSKKNDSPEDALRTAMAGCPTSHRLACSIGRRTTSPGRKKISRAFWPTA